MTIAISGTNGITLDGQFNSASSMGFKNRIINGGMVIDQRNAGASVTPTADNTYTLDRWKVRNGGGAGRFSVIQSSTSAANFPTSALLTVTTTSAPSGVEFYGLGQDIEGYNMADFGWGTANAQAVTLSFQVRSSLTGTYCISIRNSGAVPDLLIQVASVTQAQIQASTVTSNTFAKTAGAFRVNDIQFSANKVLGTADILATLPVVTQFSIGSVAGASFLNGTIRKIVYYPIRVTNAQLQALTS